MSTQQQPQLCAGIVKQEQLRPCFAFTKQVISGDTVILRGQPRGGPPKEKTLGLSNIMAPKLARRLNPKDPNSEVTVDEPYAWEAREFLRKKLIGKEVCFVVERKNEGPKEGEKERKEYGLIYLGRDITGENISESLVSEGLVDVRRTGIRQNEAQQRLCDLEDNAKAMGKGKHGPEATNHVRVVHWNIENKRNFMDSFHRKPIKAIVEHVRDGSTLRLVLLPDYYYITLMLSGIRCPTFRVKDSETACDPFAEEAKFFTECRLMQRDVDVILESVSNQSFLGTIIHPNGNITELLLSEGFAKCVDWSLQFVTGGLEKLRAAERQAKEKRLRVWKDYVPSGPAIDAKEREFQGKVVEVFNADTLIIKTGDGNAKKIFLASIRPPRLPDDNKQDKLKVRPLYDIPYMFEAREFLRKKLIGKKVNVTIDYIQPAKKDFEKDYPEKVCCTVTIGDVNVAEALISKGLATVVKYRADDDQRSAHYDELLAAETKAQKSGKGVHSKKKDTPAHRVVDLSGDLAKSKQFLPFLQRAGRMEAIVEFVASGSRLRLYVPRENCLVTFLLAGITCAKAGRIDTRYNERIQGDPWGDEALAFTKDLCMQREVEVEVETMDKAGNFIGWLWSETVNLSVALVREGFAEVHVSAERSTHYRALQQAETEAKNKKTKMWENHVPVELEPKEESERIYEPKLVEITEVRPDMAFYAQHHEDGPKLVDMLQQLRLDLSTNAPLPGSYIPKKNDICAALFSEDGLWYRAKVEKVEGKSVHIIYIDYGNREITNSGKLAVLPANYQTFPPAAHEYSLAFVSVPKDPESAEDARQMFIELAVGTSLFLNVEYKSGSSCVTLMTSSDDKKRDIGKELVENGYLVVENRKEKKFKKIIVEYFGAQDMAKKKRLNLWRYGDITEDDAKEFG